LILTTPPPITHLINPNRYAATTHVSNSEGDAILAKQRLNRPVSPHLSIYKPQITWISSSLNRITGVALSGSFYLFGLAYLVSPLLGWHLDSHSIAAAVAAWPVLLKVFSKFVIAMPFTYHSFNSIRHLIWDTGSQFTNRQVIITGWTAVAVSVVSALALTFY
jgi:succinate dehydrogenase (ubiquinone) cytochrome b560 subunit